MRRFQLLALFVVLTAVLGGASVATAGNGVTTTHKDSETCAVDDPVAPNGHYTFDPGDWISDYEAFVNPGGGCERPNIAGSTVVVTANGRIWTIEAYYDPSFTCL